MASRAWLIAAGFLAVIGLSGCPMTDDYYINSSHVLGSSGSQGAGETMLTGGASPAGAGGATGANAGAGVGGAVGGSNAAQAGGGAGPGTGGGACTATIERCNGHDDDCDELVDELACSSTANGTIGCSGFVLPGNPHHGYMLCTGTKAHDGAQAACATQNMRLAWLETAAENSAVAKKVAALSNDAEVSFGARDAENEGAWFWDAGEQFWSGDESGRPVAGLFNAWIEGTPNDGNNDEDCAVLLSASAGWGDRSCSAKYSYLCEEMGD
jgi:hypothetical protein